MLYVPDGRYRSRFKMIEWLLPQELLPWLYAERGLSIHLLPQNDDLAKKIILERLRAKDLKLTNDKRKAHQTAHYRNGSRAIVIPHRDFVSVRWTDTVLHEVGHAVDFLFLESGEPLSLQGRVAGLLRPEKPLSEYCHRKDSKIGYPMEQFATSFAAYFREPERGFEGPTVDDIGEGFIEFMNRISSLFGRKGKDV